MQNRLSLAALKAKANVIKNTEFITGGEESGCHIVIAPMQQDGTVNKQQGGSVRQ